MALIDGLVSWWKLDETSGSVATDSHGVNNGTIVNALIGQTGKVNNCYYFDGSGDYIDIPNNTSLEITGDLSFAGWVKWTNWGDTDHHTFLAKGNHSSNRVNYLFGRWDSSGNRYLKFVWNDGSWKNVTDTSGWQGIDGVWYHIVIVVRKADGYVDFYVDGSLKSSVPASITNPSNTDPARIGVNLAGAEEFPGYLDEIGLWNRALTSTEVGSLYNGGSGVSYDDIAVTYKISGTVTYLNNPVQGATVKCIKNSDNSVLTTTTNSLGYYEFTVESGQYYHVIVEYDDGMGNKYHAYSYPYIQGVES